MGIKRGRWYTVVRYNMRECEKRVKLDLKIYGWLRDGILGANGITKKSWSLLFGTNPYHIQVGLSTKSDWFLGCVNSPPSVARGGITQPRDQTVAQPLANHSDAAPDAAVASVFVEAPLTGGCVVSVPGSSFLTAAAPAPAACSGGLFTCAAARVWISWKKKRNVKSNVELRRSSKLGIVNPNSLWLSLRCGIVD